MSVKYLLAFSFRTWGLFQNAHLRNTTTRLAIQEELKKELCLCMQATSKEKERDLVHTPEMVSDEGVPRRSVIKSN